MVCWTGHLEGPKMKHVVAVTVGHRWYSFGQSGYTNQLDARVFNTVSLRWNKLPPVRIGRRAQKSREVCSELKLYRYTAVLIEPIIYIWGRYNGWNVFYAFNVDAHTWFQPEVSGTVPVPSWIHTAVASGKVMYVMYGASDEYYKLDTTKMVWSLIKTSGNPLTPPLTLTTYSDFVSISATIIGTKMFVVGSTCKTDTVGVLDMETNCWLSQDSVQNAFSALNLRIAYDHFGTPYDSFAFHQISAFAYNGEIYICSGRHILEYQYLWKVNPETFSWMKIELKGKGQGPKHKMTCWCMVGDRIFFLGPNDLYILDISPSLKTLCQLAVLQYGLERTGLPHNIKWEMAAMSQVMPCIAHWSKTKKVK